MSKVLTVCGKNIGKNNFIFIAGPCAVESEEQIIKIAKSLKKTGVDFLRGGAFKPRTSPYDFQGLGKDGINMLIKAKKETGLPVITEITDVREIEYFKDVDIIQIGARNQQNYELIKEVAKTKKPILLKRGFACTLSELLMSAEYAVSEGNSKVILCERGIRTFESETRNTLDVSAIPILKSKSEFPVIVDPSHASGKRELVLPLSLSAVGAGADGLMIEVHDEPEKAIVDGAESLNIKEFNGLYKKVNKMLTAVDKKRN